MRTRLLSAVALAAAATLALSACGSGSGGDDKKITIGIKFDQPGLGFQAGSTYSGFDVDVATYIAKKLGYDADQITWKESPSAQRESLLSSHQVDMVVATYSITDERKKTVAFAGPYFVAGQDLLVANDNSDITGPDALAGKKLCSVTGSTSAQKIKDTYADTVQLVEYPGYAECVTALTSGAVDAVTTDDIILAGLAAQPQNKGKVKLVGSPFSEESYGVGIPQDSTQCQAISDAITSMISDGSWQKFLDKNTDGTGYKPDADKNPPTVAPCGASS
ncbi:glutamate ABC transporter substrate-binding protein [Luteimicrobium subarcticum]|uniref:Amino acid ABC transporter substrate-binding protein (PAAT family) n=1 Tax=Luteimicrobium subarcticum TaxID=620910 RepID=A0A2M8WTZ4_9MICO|nr:glutamate ABC transporter substrate-binding protein [Luteimicrobium subarcticum]PJI94374.1 amino acid ABC transporter substrate-binding protein (PAAT family) [Luteimicrobium subarcticum]